MLLIRFRAEHLKERVVQGAEIRIDLRLQVARQEAELVTRFDGGARQNDAVDLLIAQRGGCGGNGKEGLTRTGRADAENDGIFLDGVDILFLTDGFRLDGLALGGHADTIVAEALELFAVSHHRDDVIHALIAELRSHLGHIFEVFQRCEGVHHGVAVVAADDDGIAECFFRGSVRDADTERFFYDIDVAVKIAEQGGSLLRCARKQDFFEHMDSPFLLYDFVFKTVISMRSLRSSLTQGHHPPPSFTSLAILMMHSTRTVI
jgi:hypothetical protein